jgi:hypothetical protein
VPPPFPFQDRRHGAPLLPLPIPPPRAAATAPKSPAARRRRGATQHWPRQLTYNNPKLPGFFVEQAYRLFTEEIESSEH